MRHRSRLLDNAMPISDIPYLETRGASVEPGHWVEDDSGDVWVRCECAGAGVCACRSARRAVTNSAPHASSRGRVTIMSNVDARS